MSRRPQFTRSEDGWAIRVAGRRLHDGDLVRLRFADEWYSGELQLWRQPPCVWVDELGTVTLEDWRGLPCQVQDLRPDRNAPRRPAA